MKNIKNNIHIYTFLFIALLYGVVNYVWYVLNTPVFMPTMMSAVHFNYVFLPLPSYTAPFVTIIMKVLFGVFGTKNYDLLIIIVNYMFFLTALFFTAKITEILKDKKTAALAMMIFALVPAVYGLSVVYGHQDWHLMAATAFNIYCLIKCDEFKNLKWSLLYGVSAAFGLMIKDAFIGFFTVPLLIVGIRTLTKSVRSRSFVSVLHMCAAGVITFVLSAYHYARRDIIKKVLLEPVTETVDIFAFENLRFYTIGIFENMLSVPVFILFCMGLYSYIFKYKNTSKIIILLWIFPVWLFLILMPHYKEIVYAVGFIPAVAVISAIGINCLKSLKIKKIIIVLTLTICFFQYFALMFGKEDVLLGKLSINIKGHRINYFVKNREIFYILNRQEIINYKQINNYINLHYKNDRVLIFSTHAYWLSYIDFFFIDDILEVYMMLEHGGNVNVNTGWWWGNGLDLEGYDVIMLFTMDDIDHFAKIYHGWHVKFIYEHPSSEFRFFTIDDVKNRYRTFFDKIYADYKSDGRIVMRSDEGLYKAFRIYRKIQ
jgi:hypothetical protein